MSDTITCAGLIARTQRWTMGLHGQPLNRLSSDVDDAATEIFCDFALNVLSANTWVGIGDELVYVWEADQGNKRLTVTRGGLGTEAIAHEAGAVIESNSRFPRASIKDTLQEEIRAWPDGVFQVKRKELEVLMGQGALDLGVTDSRFYEVLAVERSPQSTFSEASRWTSEMFRVDRQMPRDTFPSGSALTLYRTPKETAPIRVLYSAPFDVDDMDDDADVVEDWGLGRSMCDIAPVGAAARLLQASEILRSDTEAMGESRVAAEVPATYRQQTADKLRMWVNMRLGQEATRLRARYRMPS